MLGLGFVPADYQQQQWPAPEVQEECTNAIATVQSADEALNLCEAGEDFDVIVSDIEMPGMSGFEFAQAIRKDTRWHATPLVALSSHASPRDLDRGRQAGFTDYVAKFDRDALLFTLSQTLSETKGAA